MGYDARYAGAGWRGAEERGANEKERCSGWRLGKSPHAVLRRLASSIELSSREPRRPAADPMLPSRCANEADDERSRDARPVAITLHAPPKSGSTFLGALLRALSYEARLCRVAASSWRCGETAAIGCPDGA